jgi:uncharacterized protein DUF3592
MSPVLSRLLRRLATLVIFVAGLFFLLLALGGHLQLLDARRLMAKGGKVEGSVTQAYSGGRRSTAYYFDYEYPAAGGLKLSGKKRSISYSDYERLRPGTKVPVWHDPGNPGRSVTTAEMAELESWANRLFFPLVGLAFLAWGIYRVVGRRPAPPAPPATPEPARHPSPVRRGE